MNSKRHDRFTQVFLVANSLFWLPWGLLNLIKPQSWSGEVIPEMDVYDLSSPVARTEVRAMYGGLQIAIGTAALVGAAQKKHRDSALGFFVLALSGLSLCRLGGMVAEGDDLLSVLQHQDLPRQVQPGRLGHVRASQHDVRLDPLSAPPSIQEVGVVDAGCPVTMVPHGAPRSGVLGQVRRGALALKEGGARECGYQRSRNDTAEIAHDEGLHFVKQSDSVRLVHHLSAGVREQ